MTAVNPNTKPILAILEPITLLIAIEEDPLTAAFKLTSNSGKEVANATTVIPITTLEILNFKDIATDALTINSPPITNKRNPAKSQKIVIHLFNN